MATKFTTEHHLSRAISAETGRGRTRIAMRETNAERKRRLYHERRVRGQCGACDAVAAPGKSRCDFHLRRNREITREYSARNRNDINARQREQSRERHLWERYRLTVANYTALLFDRQLYCCAVCWRPFSHTNPPTIDHDHHAEAACVSVRNCVRGIVHRGCNNLVGVVERGEWAGFAYADARKPASGRDPYTDLLTVGRYLARGYAFPA